MQSKIGLELKIVRYDIKPYGWIFYYDVDPSGAHASEVLAGNAPFLVTASDGQVHVLGAAHPIEFYLKRFEQG
jgi:hypothetical protein